MRILCLSFLLLFSSVAVQADPFALAGTSSGSFNGAPFSSIASLHDITFSGGAFVFRSSPSFPYEWLVPNGACGCEGPGLGTMSWTGSLAGLSSNDVFTLRLTFDGSANVPFMDFAFRLRINPNTTVVGFELPTYPGFYGNPISFSTGIYSVNGAIGVGIQNLTTFHPDAPLPAAIHVSDFTPPRPVPEPATVFLLSSGILALARKLRSRRV